MLVHAVVMALYIVEKTTTNSYVAVLDFICLVVQEQVVIALKEHW